MVFKAMKLNEHVQGVSRNEKERGPGPEAWGTTTPRDHLKEEDFTKDIKKWPAV